MFLFPVSRREISNFLWKTNFQHGRQALGKHDPILECVLQIARIKLLPIIASLHQKSRPEMQ